MNYKKILIVDDSVTSRMIIKRCFKIAGFTESDYFEAENGLHALSFLEGNFVDLIVTDINMPKMDGTSLAKKLKIKDDLKNVPVIVISSIGGEITEDQLKEMGIMGVIKKPLSPAKILELLGDKDEK